MSVTLEQLAALPAAVDGLAAQTVSLTTQLARHASDLAAARAELSNIGSKWSALAEAFSSVVTPAPAHVASRPTGIPAVPVK